MPLICLPHNDRLVSKSRTMNCPASVRYKYIYWCRQPFCVQTWDRKAAWSRKRWCMRVEGMMGEWGINVREGRIRTPSVAATCPISNSHWQYECRNLLGVWNYAKELQLNQQEKKATVIYLVLFELCFPVFVNYLLKFISIVKIPNVSVPTVYNFTCYV